MAPKYRKQEDIVQKACITSFVNINYNHVRNETKRNSKQYS